MASRLTDYCRGWRGLPVAPQFDHGKTNTRFSRYDSALMRRTLKRIIESAPDLELGVGDGEDAVVKARELRPDVISMDINMPKLDGISALQIVLQEDLSRCRRLFINSAWSGYHFRMSRVGKLSIPWPSPRVPSWKWAPL